VTAPIGAGSTTKMTISGSVFEATLLPHNDVIKAMNYMLDRIESFTCFLKDGRICISNNAAELALRGIALGRKA
jgi:transposase